MRTKHPRTRYFELIREARSQGHRLDIPYHEFRAVFDTKGTATVDDFLPKPEPEPVAEQPAADNMPVAEEPAVEPEVIAPEPETLPDPETLPTETLEAPTEPLSSDE